MKTRLLLIIPLLLLGFTLSAKDAPSIYHTWTLTKVVSEGVETDYTSFEKTFTVVISKESISYSGSCTPCSITDFSVDNNTITYNSKPNCEEGCCFFDNPHETLMNKPDFSGTYVLTATSLVITKGNTVYYFSLQNPT